MVALPRLRFASPPACHLVVAAVHDVAADYVFADQNVHLHDPDHDPHHHQRGGTGHLRGDARPGQRFLRPASR